MVNTNSGMMNTDSGQAERSSVTEGSWELSLFMERTPTDGSPEATDEKTSRRSSTQTRDQTAAAGPLRRRADWGSDSGWIRAHRGRMELSGVSLPARLQDRGPAPSTRGTAYRLTTTRPSGRSRRHSSTRARCSSRRCSGERGRPPGAAGIGIVESGGLASAIGVLDTGETAYSIALTFVNETDLTNVGARLAPSAAAAQGRWRSRR
jgi:hypothetical protein